MKNGKRPTLQQKLIMKSHGLQPDNWLVVKNTTEHLEVVSFRRQSRYWRNKDAGKIYFSGNVK